MWPRQLLASFGPVGLLAAASCQGFVDSEPARAIPTDNFDCAVGSVVTVGSDGDYERITDALAQARRIRYAAGELTRARSPICIDVAAGTYIGAFAPEVLANNPGYEALPLVIDVPSVSVRGATQLTLDEHDRPTAVVGEAATLIAHPFSVASGPKPYFFVATTERVLGEDVVRSSGNDARVEGFVFNFGVCSVSRTACRAGGVCPNDEPCEAARGGSAIWTHLVQDYTVRGNAVMGAGGFAIQHSFSSGRTVRNLLTGNAPAGISYRGPAPGKALVSENTSTDNVLGGMTLVCSAGNFPLPVLEHEEGVSVVPGPVDGEFDRTDVELIGNNLSHHTEDPDFSFGLRQLMFSFAKDSPREANCTVTARLNEIIDTSFGVVVDGGFPYLNLDGVPMRGPWSAMYGGNYERNNIQGYTEDTMVTLTRFTSTRDCRELDPDRAESYQFLRNSTYRISHQGEFDAACYDNREIDPHSGGRLRNTLRIGDAWLTGRICSQVATCD